VLSVYLSQQSDILHYQRNRANLRQQLASHIQKYRRPHQGRVPTGWKAPESTNEYHSIQSAINTQVYTQAVTHKQARSAVEKAVEAYIQAASAEAYQANVAAGRMTGSATRQVGNWKANLSSELHEEFAIKESEDEAWRNAQINKWGEALVLELIGIGVLRLAKGSTAVPVCAPKGGDFMNEAGQLGGELFPADKIPGLVKYLDRRGIYVHEAVNGSFDGVRGVITLPRNPTKLNVRHELSHMLDYRKYGDDYYKLFTPAQREQLVLERLKNNRIWDKLNDAERDWSLKYPSARR